MGGEAVEPGVDPHSPPPLPNKGSLKLCENYHTISLVSYPSKVMLHILFNRLKN
ncbi:hypothetical protein DPMN_139569 [Dreissena polymorpha]|uniref:Uncharacterized protein n=1 Tax=Dreissena polymorpha TaxID=45954 RepID=A0A9D4G639_DREPO|nr:hypothetical protein DPMN_139569 [Dreissena polymorpha]